MTRINVYKQDPEGIDEPFLEGWFDPDKATRYDQGRDWNGHNNVGVITRSQWVDEELYRTSGGRWVRHHDATRYHNGGETYEFLDDEQAKDWLLRSECNDDAIAKWFGEVAEERGPGRPEIGQEVKFRIDADWLALVDKLATEAGVSRAEQLRRLVDFALDAAAVRD